MCWFFQKVAKWATGASGQFAAQITRPADLSGVWKQEPGKLLKSQQKTQYHVPPLQSPEDAKWP